MTGRKKMPKKVVYILWSDDSGIFMVAEDYFTDTKIQIALETAETWGDFKSLMPKDEFASLPQWWRNGGEQIFEEKGAYDFIDGGELPHFMETLGKDYIIHAADKFDSMDVWGVGDGDYPRMNNNTCDDSFPDEFIHKFGTPVSSMVAGSWTEYSVEKMEEMTAYLNELGTELVHDLSMDPLSNVLSPTKDECC